MEATLATSGVIAAAAADEVALGAGVASLPVAIDNSKLPYFPPIRSRESLGSCASFATTCYTMTYMTAMVQG
ncbi:MAG: hypothetical protein NTY19_41235 [Planctomycetota bacterium]|nr:hypothetical protein [Planctomycetota bacterium]